MASPISWLALEGVKKGDGTANAGGSLYFYSPGTNTRATVYWDRNETATVSQPAVLDNYGRTTRSGAVTPIYSRGPVDITAFDSSGTLIGGVGRFNAVHANSVEVETPGFTGTLSTGLSGDGGRSPLNTVLETAYTSFGGKDFKFKDSANGTEREYYKVIKERGLSVKDRGAVGDGVATDTSAFTNAIAIIKAAGGGRLIIPPGTYLIDATLTVDFNGLLVEGAGINASIIKMSAVSNTTPIFTVTGGVNVSIQHLQLTTTANANTGNGAIYATSAAGLYSSLKITNFDKGIHINAGFWDTISNCVITANSATTHCIYVAGATKYLRINNNYFTDTGNAGICIEYGASSAVTSSVISNNFADDAMTSGLVIESTSTSADIAFYGNDFSLCTTSLSLNPTTQIYFREHGNKLGTSTVVDSTSRSVASATGPLPIRGPGYYLVTGTADITGIYKKGFPIGGILILKFESESASAGTGVTHNSGAPGTDGAKIALLSGASLDYAPDDTLMFTYDGTYFIQIGGVVIDTI